MKKLIFLITILLVLFSCDFSADRFAIDVKNLELNIVTNNDIVNAINSDKEKLKYERSTTVSNKEAQRVEHFFKKTSELTDQLDNYLLNVLNTEISSSQYKVVKNDNQLSSIVRTEVGNVQVIEYFDFSKIEQYRDKLLEYNFSSIRRRGFIYKLNITDFSSYDTLSSKLEELNHSDKFCILSVYKLLSDIKELSLRQDEVNSVNFISLVRNKVRLAEKQILSKILYRFNLPVMRINKVDAVVFTEPGEIKKGDKKILSVIHRAYDSTKTYLYKYRYDKKVDYTFVYDNGDSLILDTKTLGKKKVEGKILVEINGKLEERDWSYEYIVNE